MEQRIRLLTTNLVLAEVHRLVLHRFGVATALRTLDRLESSQHLSVEFATVEDHRGAREWLRKFADQPITYTDAISFTVMRARRCRAALTFDRHFEMAGFQRWLG